MGMKKLYFLNEEESKRILNLHKEATKKQYLKEVIDEKSGQEIPGGISQDAYDKIMQYSKEMKRTFQGALLNDLQQKAIDNDFGVGTYANFWRDSGDEVLRNGGLQASGSKAVVRSVGQIPNNPNKAAAEKAAAEKAAADKAVADKAVADKLAAASRATKGPLVTQIQQILKQKGFKLGTSGPNKDGVDGVMGNITLNGIVSALGAETSTATKTQSQTTPDAATKAGTTPVGKTPLSSNKTSPGSVAKTANAGDIAGGDKGEPSDVG
jgi:hypothetical protein